MIDDDDQPPKTESIPIPPELRQKGPGESPPPRGDSPPPPRDTRPAPVTEDRLPISPGSTRDRATLRIVTGPQVGSVFSLTRDVTTIGRGRESDLSIDDLGVSRVHARVLREPDGRFFIEDMGSRNGTFVKDVRVAREVLLDGVRIGLGPMLMLRFAYIDEVEEGMLRQLYESSVLDALTGAHNRKHFDERLVAEVAYSERHHTDISLILFDLDHFKLVNDTLGHLAGDEVLRTTVSLVKKALRTEDVLARIGGEEFAIIARGIGPRHGRALGERVRALVARAKFDLGGQVHRVTVSVGVASFSEIDGEATVERLIEQADQRLYKAKAAGRNRTVGDEG